MQLTNCDMGFDYLNGKNWREITRDERTFCAELFFETRDNPGKFVDWLAMKKVISLDAEEKESEWELGFEVCFYRDFRKLNNQPIKDSEYSQKRTFDLCLFSSKRIIIIEAKAQKGFEGKQNEQFKNDKLNLPKILNSENIKIEVIALASSKYFVNKAIRGGLDKVFTGHFSWLELHNEFISNPVFIRADESYKN